MQPNISDFTRDEWKSSILNGKPSGRDQMLMAALPAGTALAGAGIGAALSKKGKRKKGALTGGLIGLASGGVAAGAGLAALFKQARRAQMNAGVRPYEINLGDASAPSVDTPNVDPHLQDAGYTEWASGQPSVGGEEEVQAAMEASGFPGSEPYEPEGGLMHRVLLALANTGRNAKVRAGEVSDDLVKYVQDNYESLLPAATALGGAGTGALIRGKGKRARGALEGGAVGLAAGALTPSAQRALEAYRLQRDRNTGRKRAADGQLPGGV